MLSITRYNPDEGSRWNEFVRSSRNGTFLFERGFMDYHSDRFDDHSLIARKDGHIRALLPANLVNGKLWSHQGLTFGGWIIGDSMDCALMLDLMRALKDHVGSCAEALVYKRSPSIYHRLPADEDLYALFRVGAQLMRRDVSTVIDLSRRLRVSSGRKDNMRRARKAGVSVVESADLESFHAILSSVLARHGAEPVHSVGELQLLRSRFPDRIRLHAAYLGDCMVAAALVFDNGRIAHTQYLANAEEGRATGALDLLLEQLISDVYSRRSYFSFGISTEDDGWQLNEGLVAQKEGFGGRTIVQDFYEIRP